MTKRILAYTSLVLGFASLHMAMDLDRADARNSSSASYWEECVQEGCGGSEVEELYHSGAYREESLNESGTANLEEDSELARPGAGVDARHCAAVQMLDHFSARGHLIDVDDYMAHRAICIH